jgi:hypothetical protein
MASEDPNLPDVNLMDGICADANGVCSLRAAIEQSDPTSLTTPVIINVPAGTFNLTNSLKLTLTSDQSNSVTVRGAGALATLLDGGDTTPHFYIRSLTTAVISIEGMTMQNGHDPVGTNGSSMQISADPWLPAVQPIPESPDVRSNPGAVISISDCIFKNNQNGYVIQQYANSGALQIHRSQFLQNNGANVYAVNTNGLLIEDSNFTQTSDRAVILRDNTGSILIRNSSFSSSYVGISCMDCRGLDLENITVYQNTASGLEILSSKSDPAFSATIRQATLFNNATMPAVGQYRGNITLGMNNATNSVTISNSIIAMPVGGGSPNCMNFPSNAGVLQATNSLFSDSSCVSGGSGNIYADALLAAPAQNGGLGPTFLPLPGSPALDSGSNALCTSTDQRGLPRLTATGPAARCDMGAVEVQ